MSKRSPEPGDTPPSLLDRLKSARIQLIGSPEFQRFAASFPLTRPVARANAGAVFDIVAGFVYSQILYACIKLDLLTALREPGMTMQQLSTTIGLPFDNTQRLLNAACALKLAERRSNDRFALGPNGAALLANPGVSEMIGHHEHFYADLSHPDALIRNRTDDTNLARFWPYASAAAGEAAAYTELMSRTQQFIAEDVLDAIPIHRFTSLLDAGGGDGTFLRAASARAPHLVLSLFELPQVARIAQQSLKDAGVSAHIHSGNMLEDNWPRGAELVSLIRILHDHDDDPAMRILSAARTALAPGGSLLIAEPTADSARAGDAYFGMYLWAMGSGRPRKMREIRSMLRRAVFSTSNRSRHANPCSSGPFLLRNL